MLLKMRSVFEGGIHLGKPKKMSDSEKKNFLVKLKTS